MMRQEGGFISRGPYFVSYGPMKRFPTVKTEWTLPFKDPNFSCLEKRTAAGTWGRRLHGVCRVNLACKDTPLSLGKGGAKPQ